MVYIFDSSWLEFNSSQKNWLELSKLPTLLLMPRLQQAVDKVDTLIRDSVEILWDNKAQRQFSIIVASIYKFIMFCHWQHSIFSCVPRPKKAHFYITLRSARCISWRNTTVQQEKFFSFPALRSWKSPLIHRSFCCLRPRLRLRLRGWLTGWLAAWLVIRWRAAAPARFRPPQSVECCSPHHTEYER